jgi:hypothetical protein
MKVAPVPKLLSPSQERIVRAVGAFRYMCAIDVAQLLFSPSSLTYVREALAALSGGKDYAQGHYLYRFPLPSTTRDNRTKVYTLGAAGRQYLQSECGLSCDWQARPGKLRTLSYSALQHNLFLTRLVVLSQLFCLVSPSYTLSQTRLSYDLSTDEVLLAHPVTGQFSRALLVPDAWVCFVRRDGLVCSVLFELDRAMEFKARLQAHVRARIEMLTSGLYEAVFAQRAVKIAYVTIGESEPARDARVKSMRAWAGEVLAKAGLKEWGRVFHFTALAPTQIYEKPDLFTTDCWQHPASAILVALLPPP